MACIVRCLRALVASWLLGGAALAWSAQDVGMISLLQGEVGYLGGSVVNRAVPFMKVREGDRFTLGEGAILRIAYFQGGRQETWRGPASFKAMPAQGEAAAGRPETAQLPAGVAPRLAQAVEVIQIARLGRAGGVTVRGLRTPQTSPAQAAEVAQARKTYEAWRAAAGADDITPELFLYTVLDNYMLYEDMRPLVKAMQERAPNSPEVRDLAAWVAGR